MQSLSDVSCCGILSSGVEMECDFSLCLQAQRFCSSKIDEVGGLAYVAGKRWLVAHVATKQSVAPATTAPTSLRQPPPVPLRLGHTWACPLLDPRPVPALDMWPALVTWQPPRDSRQRQRGPQLPKQPPAAISLSTAILTSSTGALNMSQVGRI